MTSEAPLLRERLLAPVFGARKALEQRPMGDTEFVLASVMRQVVQSGVQTHTLMFERYLRGRGRRVSIIDPLSARSALVTPVFAARYGIAPFHEAAGVWWYLHWHERYLRKALLHHLRGSVARRVIYAQDPVSALAALKVRTNDPVVMVVHFNPPADEWPDNVERLRVGSGRPRSSMYQDLWWRLALDDQLASRLDGVVYVSHFMKAAMEDRLPSLRRVPSEVIPNFVDYAEPLTRAPVRDIITVGGLEPRKNQAYLLEILAAAMARGHRYTLTVVGQGPDRSSLVGRAHQLGIADQVQFVGHRSDVRRLMGEHRVYCHTSRMENLPLVLIEAMSASLPVLAVPVGGVPEVIRAGVDGILWQLEEPHLAAGQLIRVLETPGLATRMGSSARERAQAEFSADLVGERLERFLLRAQRVA